MNRPDTRSGRWPLLVLAIVIAALALRLFRTSDDRASQAGPDHGVPIGAAQLAALADGTLPDGEKVLASWVRPFFVCRSVVSRAEPGKCAIGWRYIWPANTEGGLRVQFSADTSVEGGPWSDDGPVVTISSPNSGWETPVSYTHLTLPTILRV